MLKKNGRKRKGEESLCNYCTNPQMCDWLLSYPTPDVIPYWKEKGIELEIKQVSNKAIKSGVTDVYVVRKCPYFKEED